MATCGASASMAASQALQGARPRVVVIWKLRSSVILDGREVFLDVEAHLLGHDGAPPLHGRIEAVQDEEALQSAAALVPVGFRGVLVAVEGNARMVQGPR